MRLLYCLLCIFATTALGRADTVEVRVGDFYYNPSAVSINEGDTVKWIWDSAGHDVVSGASQSSDGAFQSDSYLSLGAGSVFTVVFDRNLINAFPKPGNQYQYYCTPHINMLGSVSVTRVAKSFRAEPTSWQVVPPGNSTTTGSFVFSLNGDESVLSIVSGDHTVSAAQSIVLRQQSLGVGGGAPLNCAITPGPPATGSCAVNNAQADALFSGDVSVEIRSTAFPNGEIRGQIYLADTSTHAIAGRVLDEAARSAAGVTVSNGDKSASTNALGQYTITAVTNGVHRLSGTFEAFPVLPNSGVSPLLVNGNDVFNRDLTVFLETTPTPSPTPTPVSTLCADTAKALEILSPRESELLSSFDVVVKLQGTNNFSASTYSLNAAAAQSVLSESFTLTARSGTNILSLQPRDASGTIQCPAIERLFTVDSALNLSNLNSAATHLSKALKIKDLKRRKRLIVKINRVLGTMAAGGSISPEYPTLSNANIQKALVLSRKAYKAATQSESHKLLKKLARLFVKLAPLAVATATPRPTALIPPMNHHHKKAEPPESY